MLIVSIIFTKIGTINKNMFVYDVNLTMLLLNKRIIILINRLINKAFFGLLFFTSLIKFNNLGLDIVLLFLYIDDINLEFANNIRIIVLNIEPTAIVEMTLTSLLFLLILNIKSDKGELLSPNSFTLKILIKQIVNKTYSNVLIPNE